MSARERILARIRDALEDRPKAPHPGRFRGGRPNAPLPPVEGFVQVFTKAGGEVVRVADKGRASAWLRDFTTDVAGVAVGTGVDRGLFPDGANAQPESAAVGISVARGAVAETGSLLLDSRDGRRTQLLPPTHVVVLEAASIHATLVEALTDLRADLPTALGLHSGPSKSADIGQILVRGVHGPGRVIALVIDEPIVPKDP